MASFAKIGLNSRVIEVVSVNNEVIKDSSGIEREELGIQFLNELYNWPIWKQTSPPTQRLGVVLEVQSVEQFCSFPTTSL